MCLRLNSKCQLPLGNFRNINPHAISNDSDSEDKENLAARLKVIANDIIERIKVEEDKPSRHGDKKLPILDLKVHIFEGVIVYEHYEKDISTKLVIAKRSAHSLGSKRSFSYI